MEYPHTLGIVAIMKNEAPYLKEWLDYHLNAGADVIYLYDNDSTDNIEEIASPYIAKGRVVYHKFPGLVPQLRCYHEALASYRYDCKYMIFLDADEFIVPTNGESIRDFVEHFFEGEDSLAVLHAYLYNFGSNGEEKADFSRGVLERFNKREKGVSEYEKPIINPRLSADFVDSPNSPYTYTDTDHVNEIGQKVQEATKHIAEKVFIAHFSAKSKEEWISRHSGSDVFFNNEKELDMEKFNILDKNEVEDNRAYEYYLKNLENPVQPKTKKISECVKDALKILKKEDLNMEEYFSAAHILEAGKYFEKRDKFKSAQKLLRAAFQNVLNNMTAYYMELFTREIPFLLKYDVMDKRILQQIANTYYKTIQSIQLLNKNYNALSRFMANKKWIDNL